MKYSELISFKPIEDTIQLITAEDREKAKEYVKTYVMSDAMAENLKVPVLDQLQMSEVVDNKGVLIVGNYGTGKSHLMSVISSIANDADDIKLLQNKKFAKDIECIAGKFEILRIEIGGVTMPLREIICGHIEEDFHKRGISFQMPDFSKVKDNKKLIKDIMLAFADKYPDKGYMIVVDEMLAYLSTRNERQIVLDLEFFRAMGEMCSKSKLRIMVGLQEKIFDNPKFSFVADTLQHVSDRFTQVIITKEATAYVVSERILKKNDKQKALIREHLEKFSELYAGMSSCMDEFVDLYPIHPSYIDVFNKVYLVENRHILKNISVCIKNIFDTDVPEDEPGIYSFDDYWPAIKSNGLLRSDPTIGKAVKASEQLEEILNRSFPKAAYKPLAIKMVYALSVHRLTTNGLDVQYGLTAENMKDDLCLFLPMPEHDAEFLLGVVNTTLKDIMTTVSGQFIVHNDENNQYFIDVDKIIDYDEKVRQKASMMESHMNRYFYDIVYSCLDWDAKEYVTNYKIYQYDLNWESHSIYREGYLFMGLPGERSTAQPERDFYIHIMPPYESDEASVQNLKDEVYLYFKSNDEFKDILAQYAAASALAEQSDGKDREAYHNKADVHRKKLIKYLSDNKNTCFDVRYNSQKKQLVEVLKGKYNRDMTFKDTIDLAASLIFDDYFNEKYPDFPVMKVKITRKNRADVVKEAYDHFAGRKTQLSTQMLESFGILDNDKIRPEGSKYALYFIDKMKELPEQGVLNFSDLFEASELGEYFDKKYQISYVFTPIIFLALIYDGKAEMTLGNGTTITASNLDQIPKVNQDALHEFKYLSKPKKGSVAELKRLFDALGLQAALLDNPNDHFKACEELSKKARDLVNSSVIGQRRLQDSFDLWGECMANDNDIKSMGVACVRVKEEFSNYSVKYNTPAKLNNFSHTTEEIDQIAADAEKMSRINEYLSFKSEIGELVSYLSEVEVIGTTDQLKEKIDQAKGDFRYTRDKIMDGLSGTDAARQIEAALIAVKDEYISAYLDEHQRKRLDIKQGKLRGKIQESQVYANLKKLRAIEIIPSSKLSEIEQEMSSLIVCADLTSEKMKASCVCQNPQCKYKMGSKERNVAGVLESIAEQIDSLEEDWTKVLVDSISDPIIEQQKSFLSDEQKKTVDDLEKKKALPKKVDEFFVSTITELLQGFEPVMIDAEEFMKEMEKLPPLDLEAFTKRIETMMKAYTKGKDKDKLRIKIMKRD